VLFRSLVILQKLVFWQPSTTLCPPLTPEILLSSSLSTSMLLLPALITHTIFLSRRKTSFGFDGLVLPIALKRSPSEITPLHLLMLPLVFPKVLFSVLFFSASTSHLLLILLPFSLFHSSNLLTNHDFTFLFSHPISTVKSIVLKIVSLPCTPGAVITPFPSNLITLTLFSSETGYTLILTRTSPRSTLRAWLFQWGSHQATQRHIPQSPVDE